MPKNANLIVDLDVREDKREKLFYIGRLEAPILIDLTQGVTFLVFTSESDDEELQIAINDKGSSSFSSFKRKRD